MNKIEEILEIEINKLHPSNQPYFEEGIYDGKSAPIIKAMKEFGKICFEAGRRAYLAYYR